MSTHSSQIDASPSTSSGPATALLQPAAQLLQNESGFVLKVEMPGVDHSSVTVSLERYELTITGTANLTGPENARCVAGLAGPRTYQRVFQISEDVDRNQIVPTVKQGVLTLTLPKSSAAQKVMLAVKGE